MVWANFWATFSPTHLVTLLLTWHSSAYWKQTKSLFKAAASTTATASNIGMFCSFNLSPESVFHEKPNACEYLCALVSSTYINEMFKITMQLTCGVTRLGEFSPIGRSVTLGLFCWAKLNKRMLLSTPPQKKKLEMIVRRMSLTACHTHASRPPTQLACAQKTAQLTIQFYN
jgi:hypothetical protein